MFEVNQSKIIPIKRNELFNIKDDFKRWLISEDLTKETIRNLISQYSDFSLYCSQRNILITDLDISIAREYMTGLKNKISAQTGKSLSAATRVKHYYCLKRLSMFLREIGLISVDFMEGIRKPQPKQPVIHGFTEEQLQAILNASTKLRTSSQYNDRTALLLYLLASTGLRINEALNLKVNDVDHNQFMMIVLGKGNKEREVPFGFSLSQLITTYLSKYDIKDNQYIFASRYGKPLAPSSIRDILRKTKKSLGPYLNIDTIRVSPHTFRHTFAKLWILKGGNTIALSRIMGHSSTSTTDKYVRLWGIDLKQSYDLCNPCGNINVPQL
ncbi:hypothetical protein BTS2_3332 [Bacillus sp. TS-2]|nr:hypothetical protein BTS2_3332 [Bacillus sp. TS-2]